MKEIARVAVDEGVVYYIQALHFKQESLRVIVDQLVRSGDSNGGHFEEFVKRYQEAFATYNMAHQELVKELIPMYVGPTYHNLISFVTDEIIVYEEEMPICCGQRPEERPETLQTTM